MSGELAPVASAELLEALGNVIEPEKIIKQYGAEIIRLWVTSVEFSDDVRLSPVILKRLAEAYRIAGNERQAAREALAFERLKKTRPEYNRLLHEATGSPDQREPLLRLARHCLDSGRYREALDHFQELASRAPSAAVFEGLAKAADRGCRKLRRSGRPVP